MTITVKQLEAMGLDLETHREYLHSMSDSEGAFPGSKKWLAAKEAADALVAFDLAHPEISASRRSKDEAERAERLAGRDILGM